MTTRAKAATTPQVPRGETSSSPDPLIRVVDRRQERAGLRLHTDLIDVYGPQLGPYGLVVYLATNLVDDPETVEVEARQRGGSVFVSLRVPEEELGKVIGRGGRIARAMRTALMISGSRTNIRASLDIED